MHAGIIEPGHFRFTANGETVVRLEARLGYVHKGIDALMAGAPIERAAQLAGRVSGDSTVAFALAFALAVEAALGVEVPPRAVWLRALAAELERLANHFGDIGAVCNDAAFAIMHAQCGLLREQVLRTADALLRSPSDDGPRHSRAECAAILPGKANGCCARCSQMFAPRFPELVELYEDTASLKDRTVGTGILSRALARAVRRRRLRRARVGPRLRCAAHARLCAVRAIAVRGSDGAGGRRECAHLDPHPRGRAEPRRWSSRSLRGLPPGPIHASPLSSSSNGAEGVALVEGFRGDILAWVEDPPRRRDRSLPPARPVVVPVAAARGGDRGQHRRRLPAVQQVVQLLVLGP